MFDLKLDKIEDGIITFRIDAIDFEEEFSTYYWAIDTGFKKDDESTRKVLLNIKNKVLFWIELLNTNSLNEDLFLPIDYADEYIGCLKISFIEHDKLAFEYGYTESLSGHEVNPSKREKLSVNDFNAISGRIELSKECLYVSIMKNIQLVLSLII